MALVLLAYVCMFMYANMCGAAHSLSAFRLAAPAIILPSLSFNRAHGCVCLLTACCHCCSVEGVLEDCWHPAQDDAQHSMIDEQLDSLLFAMGAAGGRCDGPAVSVYAAVLSALRLGQLGRIMLDDVGEGHATLGGKACKPVGGNRLATAEPVEALGAAAG